MRKFFGVILTITFLSSLVIISSCSEKSVNVGNLHITVVDSTGAPMEAAGIFISSSLLDMQTGYHVASAWTNSSGQVFFDDLAPGYYWYSAKGWNDSGAAMVYAGEDIRVYLWLNSHDKK
ncbi:MAG: carboxypeptidase-like regulatory domain-containing protein [Bacteroidetes bacterium]|nr:carboxypeptidase-like regulatory domain-containing protein [Bacteroidota bacterium]